MVKCHILGGIERTLEHAPSSVDSYEYSSYQSYQVPSSPSVAETSHDVSSEVSRSSVPAIALPSRIGMLQEPLRTSLPPSYTAPSSTSDSHTVLYPSVLSQNRPSDHAYASPSSTTSRDRLRKKPPKHSNVAVGQRPAVRATRFSFRGMGIPSRFPRWK